MGPAAWVHFPGYPGDELTDNGPNYQVIVENIRPLTPMERLDLTSK